MSKDEAFKWYYQGCKDTDYIDERTARLYFEQAWHKSVVKNEEPEHNFWID